MLWRLAGTQEVYCHPLIDAAFFVVILHNDYNVFAHLRFELLTGPKGTVYDPPVNRLVSGVLSYQVLYAADP